MTQIPSKPQSHPFTRRDFIQAGGAGLAAAFMPRALAAAADASATARPTAPVRRPNILYIWTDQQTRAAMSNTGNRWLRTPAMDSLARDGVTFERCYSADPISVPSRTSWITGRMPHETGVPGNGDKDVKFSINAGVPALSRLMKDAGYDTGYVGKWHIPTKISDTGWSGFDFAHSLTKGATGVDQGVPGLCEEFLRRKREKPFFLVASFVNPHDICEWARLASGINTPMLNGAPVTTTPPIDECPPLPENPGIPDNEPSVIRELQKSSLPTYPVRDWPDDKWRQYRWAYYRLVEAVDAQIGKILGVLRETGQDENTLVIFSSDHGDGTGAHKWNQKTLFYEEISGIPFIVRPPRAGAGADAAKTAGLGRRDRRSFVSMNLDFFPTVFDYAGIETPAGLRGRSLRPIIEGRAGAKAHDFAFSANFLQGISGETGSGDTYGRMIRTERYKYVRFSSGTNREQLFDLQNDPGEMRDLKTDRAHAPVLEEHRTIMDKWLRDAGDPLASLPGWAV